MITCSSITTTYHPSCPDNDSHLHHQVLASAPGLASSEVQLSFDQGVATFILLLVICLVWSNSRSICQDYTFILLLVTIRLYLIFCVSFTEANRLLIEHRLSSVDGSWSWLKLLVYDTHVQMFILYTCLHLLELLFSCRLSALLKIKATHLLHFW